MGVALLSYCAVSPRSLPFPEYNRQFLQNLLTVGIGALPSLLVMLFIYDGKYNNINTVVSLFILYDAVNTCGWIRTHLCFSRLERFTFLSRWGIFLLLYLRLL